MPDVLQIKKMLCARFSSPPPPYAKLADDLCASPSDCPVCKNARPPGGAATKNKQYVNTLTGEVRHFPDKTVACDSNMQGFMRWLIGQSLGRKNATKVVCGERVSQMFAWEKHGMGK